MAHARSWLLVAVLALMGAQVGSCASGSAGARSQRVRPGVFVSRSLGDDLRAQHVEIDPASGTIPMSVSALVRWDGSSTQLIEYRIDFSPSSAAEAPWKSAVLRPGEESLLADSAYDARATRWRMEIRPRR